MDDLLLSIVIMRQTASGDVDPFCMIYVPPYRAIMSSFGGNQSIASVAARRFRETVPKMASLEILDLQEPGSYEVQY